MTPHEPVATRNRLRDALAEAVASYASAEAAAADATPVAATPTDQAPAGLRPVAAAPVDAAPASAAPVDELRAAIAERDQYLDHLQRLKAEFENYRKRVQRDNEALVLRAGEGVLESLLPVLDNMARALESAERHEEGQLIKGVELVSGQLRAVLEAHGLDEVPAAPGLPFDPNVHEAVVAQKPRPTTPRARSPPCWKAATCCTAGCCVPPG